MNQAVNSGAYEYEYIIDMHQYPIVVDAGFWLVLIDHWSKIEVESGDRISKKKPLLLYDDMYLNSTFLNSKISNISFVYDINFMLVGYINYII